MKNITKILLLLTILASLIEAKPLKSDGWNLMSVCVDMNRSDINMSGITQIQSQDGKFIFTGDYASWSDLDVLKAGYGYWVNGSKGVDFNEGKATGKLMIPLSSDGWNLMAMCEDRQASDLDMTGISQIQSQDGKFIFTGAYASWSDLDVFESGYGYWVNGSAGLLFSSKDGVSLPQGYDFPMINNQGIPQETTLDGYTIKLFANYDNPADQQQNHKGVKVKINNGELSELLTIQNNYIGKNLIVGVYNNIGDLVAVSELIEITTGTLPILVNINFEDPNGNSNPSNTPPTLTSIPNQTIANNVSSMVIELNATDADGDTITFDANSSDVAMVTTSITGNQLTLTRLTNDGGTYTITVSASDGNASDVKSFTLTVPTVVTDTENPVVTLNGSSPVNVTVGDSYSELGATVTDNVDTGLVAVITGTVDTNTIGIYTLTYTATDSAGNVGTATRIVKVVASDDGNDDQNITLPNGFTNEVINNLGNSVSVSGDYGTVRLYANYAEVADDQANHVGISVNLDGKAVPTMQIQNTYRGHEIVAALYNSSDELIAVSSPILVDASSSVTVINLYSDGNPTRPSFSREMLNQAGTVWNVYAETNDTTGEQYWEGSTLDFNLSTLIAQHHLVNSVTVPELEAEYNITNSGELTFYDVQDNNTSYISIVEMSEANMTICWSDTPNNSCSPEDYEYIYFDLATAQSALDGFNRGENNNSLSKRIVGSTQYFANSSGAKGYRVYSPDDNTYTGSITLANGTVLNVSGTYAIDGDVITITRTEPSDFTLTLTYTGDNFGGITFDVSSGGNSSRSVSFPSENERDAFLENQHKEVSIEFDQPITFEDYNNAPALDISALGGVAYDLRYSSYEGADVERFIFGTDFVNISQLVLDRNTSIPLWVRDKNVTIHFAGNEIEVDEENNGEFTFKIKFVGTPIDNNQSIIDILTGQPAVEIYQMMYTQLIDQYKFYDENDYERTHGNLDREFYTSVAEFVETQQNGKWFMPKNDQEGQGGIAFATGSEVANNNGTLVEVDQNGNITQSNAGRWAVDLNGTLVTEIEIDGYGNNMVLKDVLDANGNPRVLRGDYNKAEDSFKFLWFNEAGKDAFLQYLTDNKLPFEGDNHDNEEPVALPEGFTYRVINNSGDELESTITLDGHNFTVKLFAEENITANDQVNHVGVFANVNGENSTFQIQNSYANVVVAVYDETSKLVAVSDVTPINGNTGISVNFSTSSNKDLKSLIVGKTLYYVADDDFGHETQTGYNYARMIFDTNGSMSWEEFETIDSGQVYNTKYHFDEQNHLYTFYGESEGGGEYSFVSETSDYITLKSINDNSIEPLANLISKIY